MSNQLKELHDWLLEHKPESANHVPDTCPVCVMESANTGGLPDDHPEGGSMSDKTYTEDELAAAISKAVAEATSPLQTKLTELENSQQQSEMDKALAAAKAEAQATIDDLQAKLDAAVIEATAAKQAKEELDAFWADAIAKAEQEKAMDERREDRLAKVKEFGGFDEKYIEENADRFVAMSDEDFDARLEEWKQLVASKGGEEIPGQTRLVASRTDTGTTKTSALAEIRNLRQAGIDPRRVRQSS